MKFEEALLLTEAAKKKPYTPYYNGHKEDPNKNGHRPDQGKHKNYYNNDSYYKHLYDVDERDPDYDWHREVLVSRIANRLLEETGFAPERKEIRRYLVEKRKNPGNYLKNKYKKLKPEQFFAMMTEIAVKHFSKTSSNKKYKGRRAREADTFTNKEEKKSKK